MLLLSSLLLGLLPDLGNVGGTGWHLPLHRLLHNHTGNVSSVKWRLPCYQMKHNCASYVVLGRMQFSHCPVFHSGCTRRETAFVHPRA